MTDQSSPAPSERMPDLGFKPMRAFMQVEDLLHPTIDQCVQTFGIKAGPSSPPLAGPLPSQYNSPNNGHYTRP